MEIEEYLKYRKELINDSQDVDGFINESSFIKIVSFAFEIILSLLLYKINLIHPNQTR